MYRHRVLTALRLIVPLCVFLSVLSPGTAWACACGCGVFNVGTSALLPTHPGGFAYLEYDSVNQNRNWSGTKRAPDDDNADKQIRTDFVTAGVQYMFDRSWGIMVELPFWARRFTTTDVNGNVAGFEHSAVGDIRVRGVYSGISSDMSSGLTFGLKLPTGPINTPDFDRDTQIGTGSTDLLLGAYHVGRVPSSDGWNWYSNVQWTEPVINAGGYRPGADVDVVLGSYYNGWKVGAIKISPLAQVVGSERWRDIGALAKSGDTGYERVLLAPGLEVTNGIVRAYADVGFPVYQRMNGNQLVATQLYKLNVGWAF
jgi:hypothetical protein